MMSAPDPHRVPRLIDRLGKRLEAVGIEAGRVEVELILCHLLAIERLGLYLHGALLVTDDIEARCEAIVERRATRYPLQFILEEAWFYGRRFFVSPAVMIPTPETELLCEAAMRFASTLQGAAPRIIDVGTGSGVIAVTMASEVPAACVTAVDISPETLIVAQRNWQTHVTHDGDFRHSDLFSAIAPGEQFDLILANPPYISESEYRELPPEVLADPKISLTAGATGMDIIVKLLEQAPSFLRPGGRIMFEIGYNQADLVVEATSGDDRFDSIAILRDLNEIDRVVILSCRGGEAR